MFCFCIYFATSCYFYLYVSFYSSDLRLSNGLINWDAVQKKINVLEQENLSLKVEVCFNVKLIYLSLRVEVCFNVNIMNLSLNVEVHLSVNIMNFGLKVEVHLNVNILIINFKEAVYLHVNIVNLSLQLYYLLFHENSCLWRNCQK